VDKTQLVSYLEKIDEALSRPCSLCVYGSAAFILLDQPARTSLDIDVAGPYSDADMGELRRAAQAAGLPINPEEPQPKDHIQWVSAVRLCLSPPRSESELVLWRGRFLTVKTVAMPDLIASKLIRYDAVDQSDIQYLVAQRSIEHEEVHAAVQRLPPPFDRDLLLLDNLEVLKQDMENWRTTP
jgi:hypothetical protein